MQNSNFLYPLVFIYVQERDKEERRMAKVFVCNAADIYKEVTEKLSRVEAKPKAKAYRNLNSMLQECYFVGATKFGNNFIA